MISTEFNYQNDIRVPFFKLVFYLIVALVEKFYSINKFGSSTIDEILIIWIIGCIISNTLYLRSCYFNGSPRRIDIYLIVFTILLGIYIILIPGVWGVIKNFQEYSHLSMIKSLIATFVGYRILYNHNRIIDICRP